MLQASVGWETPVALSKVEKGIYSHNPHGACSDDLLAVVWEEKNKKKKQSSLHVSFGSSEKNLVEKTLMTYDKIYNLEPKLLIENEDLLIVYSSPDGEIYIIRGREKGQLWYPPLRLTFTTAISLDPFFYYDKVQDKIYIFYLEEESGNFTLKTICSLNHGATWQESRTILSSEKTGVAVFFPFAFVKDGKFYIIYQGRFNNDPAVKGRDSIFIAVIDEKDGKLIKNEPLVSSQQEAQNTPIANNLLNNVFWQESFQNNWNIYMGRLDQDKVSSPVRINTENKNCYGHSVLISKNKDAIKIFWSMMDGSYYQIYSRKFFLKGKKFGNQSSIVSVSNNCYSPDSFLFKGEEMIVWQGEMNADQSAIFLQKEDTSALPPVFLKPVDGEWQTNTDLNILWKAPDDPSGIGGYGFSVNKKADDTNVVLNLPGEVTSLNMKNYLKEGTNVFRIRLFDGVGNASPFVTKFLNVDLSGPVINSIDSPTHPLEKFVTNQTAIVHINAVDQYQKVEGFAYQIDYGAKGTLIASKIMSRDSTLRLSLQKGISYLKVKAVDSSGLWGSTAVYPFYVSERVVAPAEVNTNKEVPNILIAKKIEPVKPVTNVKIAKLTKKTNLQTNVSVVASKIPAKTNIITAKKIELVKPVTNAKIVKLTKKTNLQTNAAVAITKIPAKTNTMIVKKIEPAKPVTNVKIVKLTKKTNLQTNAAVAAAKIPAKTNIITAKKIELVKPVTNVKIVKLTKKTNLQTNAAGATAKVETKYGQPAMPENEAAPILKEYLKNSSRFVSVPIYNSKTRDILGDTEDFKSTETNINGVRMKHVTFRMYTTSVTNDPSGPPAVLYVWTPLLNYSSINSRDPFVPAYQIKESKLYNEGQKSYRYFNVDISVLPDADFIVVFSLRGKLMSGSIIKSSSRIDPSLMPASLKWFFYE